MFASLITVRRAGYNSAGTDIQGGQSNCPEKEENKSGIQFRESAKKENSRKDAREESKENRRGKPRRFL